MKRLVTRNDQSGKSVFVSEDESPRQAAHAAGGFCLTQVWATEEVPVLPAPGGDPTIERYQFFPGPGGTPFLIARFPPAATAEQGVLRPLPRTGGTDGARSPGYARIPYGRLQRRALR